MSQTLAIGGYRADDAEALQSQFNARLLPGIDDLSGLDTSTRNEVTALAYLGHSAVGAEHMNMLPSLKLIANFGVGYDAIDVDAAQARGIAVTNTPDVLNDDVADLAVCMWITACRGLAQASDYLRRGDWAARKPFPLTTKASGRRVGIVGMGRIGRAIADRLVAFQCEIHYTSRSPKDVPGMTWHADIISMAHAVDDLIITIVGGPQTQNLIGAEVLAALGEGYVINVARGSVVDEDALIAALGQGQIAGAALDVFAREPDPDPRLLDLPNLWALPHVGSATVQTRSAMGALQRANVAAFLEGKPLVTPVF